MNIDSGTGQIDGINSIISYLEQWLSNSGFDMTLYPSGLFGNNLVARRQWKGRMRLLLIGMAVKKSSLLAIFGKRAQKVK